MGHREQDLGTGAGPGCWGTRLTGGTGLGPEPLGWGPLRPRGKRTATETANLSCRLSSAADQQHDLG